MPQKCYIVTVQVFACGGGELEVTAHDEAEAETKAKKTAEALFAEGYYDEDMSLSEVCISCIQRDEDDDRDYDEPIDPSPYAWTRACDAKHPLPEGTLLLSVKGEEDEGDHGPRKTGPKAVGIIDMVQPPAPGQGHIYGVSFASHNCVYVNPDERDFQDNPDDYWVCVLE